MAALADVTPDLAR